MKSPGKCDENDDKRNKYLTDTQREKHHKVKLQRLQKLPIGHLGRWYIKLSLFKRF